jgi:hypothetical protein
MEIVRNFIESPSKDDENIAAVWCIESQVIILTLDLLPLLFVNCEHSPSSKTKCHEALK